MIRGFDQSLREMIGALGPDTIFVQRFSFTSFSNPAEAKNLFKRPNLTISDARAIEEGAPAVADGRRRDGARRPSMTAARVLPRPEDQGDGRDRLGRALRRRHARADPRRTVLQRHRAAVPQERRRARRHTPTSCCSRRSGTDPIGKTVRVGPERFTVVGVFDKTPSAGGFNLGADDFVAIPYTVYQRVFGLRAVRITRNATMTAFMISVIPREGVSQAAALADVERVMRSRHGLEARSDQRLRSRHAGRVPQAVGPDQPGHVLRARRDLVDRADGRRHRRDGDHVDLGHRADARDRRAQGARRAARRDPVPVPGRSRRADVGRRTASASRWARRSAGASIRVGLPHLLPWWSFAIGIGFSAAVGLFFGMYPPSRPRASIRSTRSGTSSAHVRRGPPA